MYNIGISSQQINKFFEKFCYGRRWSRQENGLIDIHGTVDISGENFKRIPLAFGEVTGSFSCESNSYLTSLEGSPRLVGIDFICNHCAFTSLKGSPEYIGGNFIFIGNVIKSLKGGPKYVGKNILAPLFLLPKELWKENLNAVLNNQEDFNIWNDDGSLNLYTFKLLKNYLKEK